MRQPRRSRPTRSASAAGRSSRRERFANPPVTGRYLTVTACRTAHRKRRVRFGERGPGWGSQAAGDATRPLPRLPRCSRGATLPAEPLFSFIVETPAAAKQRLIRRRMRQLGAGLLFLAALLAPSPLSSWWSSALSGSPAIAPHRCRSLPNRHASTGKPVMASISGGPGVVRSSACLGNPSATPSVALATLDARHRRISPARSGSRFDYSASSRPANRGSMTRPQCIASSPRSGGLTARSTASSTGSRPSSTPTRCSRGSATRGLGSRSRRAGCYPNSPAARSATTPAQTIDVAPD